MATRSSDGDNVDWPAVSALIARSILGLKLAGLWWVDDDGERRFIAARHDYQAPSSPRKTKEDVDVELDGTQYFRPDRCYRQSRLALNCGLVKNWFTWCWSHPPGGIGVKIKNRSGTTLVYVSDDECELGDGTANRLCPWALATWLAQSLRRPIEELLLEERVSLDAETTVESVIP